MSRLAVLCRCHPAEPVLSVVLEIACLEERLQPEGEVVIVHIVAGERLEQRVQGVVHLQDS